MDPSPTSLPLSIRLLFLASLLRHSPCLASLSSSGEARGTAKLSLDTLKPTRNSLELDNVPRVSSADPVLRQWDTSRSAFATKALRQGPVSIPASGTRGVPNVAFRASGTRGLPNVAFLRGLRLESRLRGNGRPLYYPWDFQNIRFGRDGGSTTEQQPLSYGAAASEVSGEVLLMLRGATIRRLQGAPAPPSPWHSASLHDVPEGKKSRIPYKAVYGRQVGLGQMGAHRGKRVIAGGYRSGPTARKSADPRAVSAKAPWWRARTVPKRAVVGPTKQAGAQTEGAAMALLPPPTGPQPAPDFGKSQGAMFDPEDYYACVVWVDQSGARKGSFPSVQAAVDSVGRGGKEVTICVSPGVYQERVVIKEGQDNITLAGYGDRTTITSSQGSSDMGGPFQAATLTVLGNFFTASHVLIRNEKDAVDNPAPAVTVYANVSTWVGVSLESWDDTVALHTGQHLFRSCHVSGLTDMIWGFGRAAFVDCDIHIRQYHPEAGTLYKGAIAVLGTDDPSNGVVAGAVFWSCRINGKAQAYLGRPYRPKQHIAYINCSMSDAVCPEGWSDYSEYLGQPGNDLSEYGSYGPGGSGALRQGGRYFTSQAPPDLFTLQNFIGRGL